MPILERDGLRLLYDVANPDRRGGTPVVLLHGLGSCGDDWPFQLPALTPFYRVITLDLPGHGKSDLPPGRVSAARLAQAVIDVLGALEENRVHLVGLSLGGMVALQTALDWQERLRSLVLVNTFARLELPAGQLGNRAVRLALLVAGPMSWTGRWVAHGLFPRSGQGPLREAAAQRIASNARGAYLRTVGAILRFDVRHRLAEIRVPTLVVAGSVDRTVPLSAKREIARSIAGARLEVIEGSGHATPLDAPEAFNAVLLRFLEGIEAGAERAGTTAPARTG
jgi:pimeloyl-ACP methyl ester carboxylesterase